MRPKSIRTIITILSLCASISCFGQALSPNGFPRGSSEYVADLAMSSRGWLLQFRPPSAGSRGAGTMIERFPAMSWIASVANASVSSEPAVGAVIVLAGERYPGDPEAYSQRGFVGRLHFFSPPNTMKSSQMIRLGDTDLFMTQEITIRKIPSRPGYVSVQNVGQYRVLGYLYPR